MADRTIMNAKDAVSASLAECFVTIGDNRYNFMQAINLEANFEKNKTEVPILGKTGKGNKATGWKGTGSATFHYNTSIFRELMKRYKDTGEDVYFDIQVTNEDPTSSVGRQTVILKDCNMDGGLLAKFDADAEYLDEEYKTFFKNMGISSLIFPEILAARDIIEGIKHSWVRQWWEVHDGALVMLGIKLRETAEILNIPLKILCGPDTCYHVVAIKRDDMTIIPNGDATLQLGDIVYFMTTKKYIPYIRKIVGKEHYEDVKNVMIMGGGRTAMHTALNVPGYMEVKIIESDPARCNELNEALGDSDVMVINLSLIHI